LAVTRSSETRAADRNRGTEAAITRVAGTAFPGVGAAPGGDDGALELLLRYNARLIRPTAARKNSITASTRIVLAGHLNTVRAKATSAMARQRRTAVSGAYFAAREPGSGSLPPVPDMRILLVSRALVSLLPGQERKTTLNRLFTLVKVTIRL